MNQNQQSGGESVNNAAKNRGILSRFAASLFANRKTPDGNEQKIETHLRILASRVQEIASHSQIPTSDVQKIRTDVQEIARNLQNIASHLQIPMENLIDFRKKPNILRFPPPQTPPTDAISRTKDE